MNLHHARRVLGVPGDASIEDIRARFYRRAKETHPDKTRTGEASEFIRLRAAYEDLLKFLKAADRPPPGAQATTGDFEWEWSLREQEIRDMFDRIRQEFRVLKLSDTLLGKLAEHIRAYTTAAELRRRIKGDAQTVARKFMTHLAIRLRQREAAVLSAFNRRLTLMYSAFYTQVRERQRRRVLMSPVFWGSMAGLVCTTTAVPFFSMAGPPLGAIIPLTLVLSVLSAYGLTRWYLNRSGTTEIIKLEPKGMAAFAADLKTPRQMTDLEGVAVAGNVIGLDFLLDGELSILTGIGLVIGALSWLFSPSLRTIQEQAITELEAHIRTHLQLEQRLDEYLRSAEEHTIQQARQIYGQNRRKAVAMAHRYPLLEAQKAISRHA
jgi:hypothetical protein